MVARSTVSDKPKVSKDFEEQVMKKINELAKNQSEVSKNSQPKTLVQESLETEVEKEVQSVPEAKVSQVRMPEIEKVEEPLVKVEAVNKELPKVQESESEVEPVTAVPVGSMLNSNLTVKPVSKSLFRQLSKKFLLLIMKQVCFIMVMLTQRAKIMILFQIFVKKTASILTLIGKTTRLITKGLKSPITFLKKSCLI